MASVKLVGLRKIYDAAGRRHVAVGDLDLDIAEGEFVVLLGPSGCGKSTTLRMIAGLETVSGGQLFIGGRLVNDVPAKDRDIAMVFQNYALYPHMTARENLAFALRLRKLPASEIERRVAAAAQVLGIEALLDRRPRQLSGGERQRVALGRALVRQPQVFLFDEPLSNLDAKLRVQMRREIARLHQELGTTMIYVTHDQVEAMTLGDRIAVLNRGDLQQLGTPVEVYQRPRNTFVAGFIGTPAMNLIEGTITAGAPPIFRAARDPFTVALPAQWSPRTGAADARVVLGIRPEDVEIVPSGGHRSDGAPLAARVELTEVLGGEALIHLSTGGVDLIARVPAPFPAARTEVRVAVPSDRVHLFEAATGLRIAP